MQIFERIKRGQDPKEVLTADLFNQIFDRIERLWACENFTAGPGLLKKGSAIVLNKRPYRGADDATHPFMVSAGKAPSGEDSATVTVKRGTVSGAYPLFDGVEMVDDQEIPVAESGHVLLRPTFAGYSGQPSSTELLFGSIVSGDYLVASVEVGEDGSVVSINNNATSSLTVIGPFVPGVLPPIWLLS